MFRPGFTTTLNLTNILKKIDAIKQEIDLITFDRATLQLLQESARFASIHFSTKIEANRLTQEQVIAAVQDNKKFPGLERDVKEVLGYDVALYHVERIAKIQNIITERNIQELHALVMAGGKTTVKPTAYRTGQNVIKDGRNGSIVYLPPEAHDVPNLMAELVAWINTEKETLAIPIVAAIAHYQFATIHPYYDGNGRTTRLLVNLILKQSDYSLNGIYSLDQYYAQNLPAYYDALTIGPSHNYYFGRAEADITSWIAYFCAGMLESLEELQYDLSPKNYGKISF